MRTPFALCIALGCGLSLAGCGSSSTKGAVKDLGHPPFDEGFVFPPSDDMASFENLDFTVEETDDAMMGPTADMPDPCLARARLVYTIDESNKFASFDPMTSKFTDIAMLQCPAANGATPFSMGVDATATAWVLFNDGNIFLVNTLTGACKHSNYLPNQNMFSTFGMGFVADKQGGLKEHLFIADVAFMKLGVIDPMLLVPNAVGMPLNGNPELTGTGAGELWAFFPDAISPHVAQIDKMTAAEGKAYQLPDLAGSPTAWAFAFWGGDFYIFLRRAIKDSSTHVWHLTAANGKVKDVTGETMRGIVGAGVSICAPISPTH